MPKHLDERLSTQLEGLRQKSRFRSLRRATGINFGSNDYLGFACDPELRSKAALALSSLPLGAASSRLLPGYHSEHSELEVIFSEFVGAERALFFSSGYAANTGVLTTLPDRHDLILYDERCHASWYDGVHASHARSIRWSHNSAEDLRQKLRTHGTTAQTIFIIVESVYSMDGDLAPLEEIAAMAREYDAVLIIDEAHATGVLGPRAAGLSGDIRKLYPSVISVHTCGKALGAAGAVVASAKLVQEYLINRCRPFIFSTALPPLLAVQVMNSIERLKRSGDELVGLLHDRSTTLRNALQTGLKRWSVPDGSTPIIPIIIGSDAETVQASVRLREAGFEVPAIRPPTVPDGSSRLRLNVSLSHSDEELRGVADALMRCEREVTA